MSRRPGMYVDDMLDAVRRVIEFSAGFDMDGFSIDRKTRDATIRNLEVLGEAAKRVPDAVRSLDPDLPWRRIAGLRDVLAHDYFGIDDAILWNVVSVEVPPLLPRLVELRRRLEAPDGPG